MIYEAIHETFLFYTMSLLDIAKLMTTKHLLIELTAAITKTRNDTLRGAQYIICVYPPSNYPLEVK
jgi:hypothetical protein